MKTENIAPRFRGRSLVASALMFLSVSAVRADYQSAVLADGPLAYYPLNLSVDTGTTASDVSDNGNPGNLVNIYPGSTTPLARPALSRTRSVLTASRRTLILVVAATRGC